MSNPDVTTNFNLNEFKCSCCDSLPTDEKQIFNIIKLVYVLQQMRNDIDSPIYINSGYRCSSHNADVGGVSDSQHLTASAADIYAETVSPIILAMLAFRYGIRSIGIGSDYIHIDLRGYKLPVTTANIWHY